MLQTTNQYQMGNPLVMKQKNIKKNVGYFDMTHMCFCLTIIGMFIYIYIYIACQFIWTNIWRVLLLLFQTKNI